MSAVVVKKVRPYPIDAVLTDTKGPQTGRIVKLVASGCLIETVHNLPMGHQYSIAFKLPVTGTPVSTVGVVVKGYTRMGGEIGKTKAEALTELHFRGLSTDAQEGVAEFLRMIRQNG